MNPHTIDDAPPAFTEFENTERTFESIHLNQEIKGAEKFLRENPPDIDMTKNLEGFCPLCRSPEHTISECGKGESVLFSNERKSKNKHNYFINCCSRSFDSIHLNKEIKGAEKFLRENPPDIDMTKNLEGFCPLCRSPEHTISECRKGESVLFSNERKSKNKHNYFINCCSRSFDSIHLNKEIKGAEKFLRENPPDIDMTKNLEGFCPLCRSPEHTISECGKGESVLFSNERKSKNKHNDFINCSRSFVPVRLNEGIKGAEKFLRENPPKRRISSGVKDFCRLCMSSEHVTFDCEEEKSSLFCVECKSTGHVFMNCSTFQEKMYSHHWLASMNKCGKCNFFGHDEKDGICNQ